jgi:hypothetical protein
MPTIGRTGHPLLVGEPVAAGPVAPVTLGVGVRVGVDVGVDVAVEVVVGVGRDVDSSSWVGVDVTVGWGLSLVTAGGASGAVGCSAPVAMPTATTAAIVTANTTPAKSARRRHGSGCPCSAVAASGSAAVDAGEVSAGSG